MDNGTSERPVSCAHLLQLTVAAQARRHAASVRFAAIGLVAAVAAVATPSVRAQQDYRCTVERRVCAYPESEAVTRMWEAYYIGKQFTVSRGTGVMAGILKNAYVTSPTVVDIGSKDNSFKAVTTARSDQGGGPGSNIFALTVNEFERTPKKSFIFLQNDEAFLGHCEHF